MTILRALPPSFKRPWLYLVVVVSCYLVYIGWLRPERYFGVHHDDTVYFSSAKALADGRGYIVPSIPSAPPQTKYPVLYAWLLSWVWKFMPSFPANIAPAVWITALFGCWFLAASFFYLRAARPLGDLPALFSVILAAFHPIYLLLSGAVMSDVPFAALMMTAVLVADRALEKDNTRLLILATAVASLSLLMRTIGLVVLAGVAADALHRRRFRQAAIVCLSAAPVLAIHMWWSAGRLDSGGLDYSSLDPFCRRAWSYYTSYWEYWKASVPDLGVVRAMLAYNFKDFAETPAALTLFPPPGGGRAGALFAVTLTVAIFSGLARQARSDRWRTLHFVFLFYVAMLLPLNYSVMDRYLIPFLPFFYSGLWTEGRHIVGMLSKAFRSSRSFGETATAGAMALGVLAIAGGAVQHYVGGLRPQLPKLAARRATLAREKEQAYEWIQGNTGSSARFVAYEDANLYLHTGRQAMRPLIFSSAAFYLNDQAMLREQLDHFTDVAHRIGARYWVSAEGDFELDLRSAMLEQTLQRLKASFGLVFASQLSKVQIYDLASAQNATMVIR